MSFEFEKFFFCFGLRTGTFIIGWLGLVNSIFEITMCFSNITETVYEFVLDDNTTRILIEQDPSDDMKRGLLALEIIYIMLNLLLLYGTYANKPVLIYPWLMVKLFVYIITIILVVFVSTWYLVNDNFMEGFVIYLIGIAVIFFLFYCWFCVYNYYKRELKYSAISRQIVMFVEKSDDTRPKNNEDLPPSYESIAFQA